jgi:hypothetical protein
MTTKDHDTDPSTPSARRPLKARATTSPPPPPAVDTDPGLAPPSTSSAPPARPLGIRVPAPSVRPPPPPESAEAALSPKKDSVELLLEGMAEQRLDRSRTTPQTDGQASASYHAEHNVRAAGRAPLEDERKVLFEQPPTPITVRLPRPPAVGAPPGVSEATVVTRAYTVRGLLLALSAGVVVVLAIFVGLQMAVRSAPAVLAVAPAPSPSQAPAAAAKAPFVTLPPAEPQLPEPAAPADSAPAQPVQARPAPTHRRTRPAASAPASDLGEFKTSY